MPKSTKKKKDKAADFSKAKLKLGKGKQAASNVVDTSFKARSIALPTQNISTGKDTDTPTTKRRLTFDALIVHLKHYNASTRRDAILGLRELLEAHPELIGVHLTTLINSCVRTISDEDANVRKTLLSFFVWLFRHVPREDIIPHSPVLLLFTTSAQTHIFPEIRIDAVRFLDVFLEHIPHIVTEGWTQQGSSGHGRRVLEGYLGILNAGTTFGEGGDKGPVQATSTASVVLSLASKLVVFKSLATFLDHALAKTDYDTEADVPSVNASTPTWYFSSSFASTSSFDAFDALLRPSTYPLVRAPQSSLPRHWAPEAGGDDWEDFVSHYASVSSGSLSWAIQELHDIDNAIARLSDHKESDSGVDAQVASALHIARTLQATLVSIFLDCAPAVFSPSSSPPETELQMVLVVCRIYRSLYGRILQDAAESGHVHGPAEADLHVMLSHLSPYFPFTATTAIPAKRDIKVEQVFQDLNLIYCELSSFLVLVSQGGDRRPTALHHPQSRSSRGKRSQPSANPASLVSSRQIQRVSEYIVRLLRGEPSSSGIQPSLSRPITPQAYVSLLPTVWSLINTANPEVEEASTSLFAALVEHAIKTSSTSAVKRHTVDFIGRLVLLDREPEYLGAFRVGRNADHDTKLEEWVLQLPKTLWELGGNHLTTSETIVRLLLRLSQRRSALFQPAAFNALRSRLMPYFVITHPARGKLPGPYSKLPAESPLRRLVLDLVATITANCSRKGTDCNDLVSAADEATQGTPEETYLTGVRVASS
ncbi:hypothetical protein C8Q77DRAFT_1082807 [Trametes polyzona]|nr:hypothetical protein C8Q77DRAFT_1082807 [Trametes polyzona]